MPDGATFATARPLVERGWRYTLIGLICALTNYAIMLTVDAAGGHYLLGTVISFVGVTPFAYLLHSRFTFREPRRWRSFVRFLGGVATAYPVAAGLMIVLCSGMNLSVAVATPITTAAVYIWNFTAAHWAILRGRADKRSSTTTTPLTAEALVRGRDNNFNLIRMLAASAVIVSHSVPLSVGPGVHEPLHGWLDPLDLGKAAVRVFFAISGFFILKSFDRRTSTTSFAMARVARIMPALGVVTCLTTLMTAAGVSFADNPFSNSVNGSLWTLSYEATCYYVLALAGLCGLFQSGRYLVFLIGFGIVYGSIEAGLIPLNPAFAFLGLPFVFGMTVYQYRRHVPLGWPLALALLALAVGLPSDASWSIALGYVALWFGGRAEELRFYNRFGDYSYGTYIFAWPVQQIIAHLIPHVSPGEMMLIALPTVWALGILSWHCIERPALEAAKRLNVGPPRSSSAAVSASSLR